MKNLKDTPMLPHYNLTSLDITNLYSNIPVKETKTIFSNILTHNLIPLKHNKNYSGGLISSQDKITLHIRSGL